MPKMSRPFTCTDVSRSPDRFFCSALLEVWTGVAAAVTMIVSLRTPTSNVSLPRSRVSPVRSVTSEASCLKPSTSTLIEYLAGGSERRRNTPRSSETAVRAVPVALSVTVTVAPGTTPLLSPTVPMMTAFPWPCANAAFTPASKTSKISTVNTQTRASRRIPRFSLPSIVSSFSRPEFPS